MRSGLEVATLGNYSLAGLAPGNYTIQATQSGYQYSTTSIQVVTEAVLEIDFTVQPNPGMIQGTVHDGASPLTHVFVQILSSNVIVAA